MLRALKDMVLRSFGSFHIWYRHGAPSGAICYRHGAPLELFCFVGTVRGTDMSPLAELFCFGWGILLYRYIVLQTFRSYGAFCYG